MFALPSSNGSTPEPEGRSAFSNGTGDPHNDTPRRGEGESVPSVVLGKPQGWQNHRSAAKNRLLVHSDEATKLSTSMAEGPPTSPPPSKLLPKPPGKQAQNQRGKVFAGSESLVANSVFRMPLSPSDFTREPRRAPLPPTRSTRPPSELFLPPMLRVHPAFQSEISGCFKPRSRLAEISPPEIARESRSISPRSSPQKSRENEISTLSRGTESLREASTETSTKKMLPHVAKQPARETMDEVAMFARSRAHGSEAPTVTFSGLDRARKSVPTGPTEPDAKDMMSLNTWSRSNRLKTTPVKALSSKHLRSMSSLPSVLPKANLLSEDVRRSIAVTGAVGGYTPSVEPTLHDQRTHVKSVNTPVEKGNAQTGRPSKFASNLKQRVLTDYWPNMQSNMLQANDVPARRRNNLPIPPTRKTPDPPIPSGLGGHTAKDYLPKRSTSLPGAAVHNARSNDGISGGFIAGARQLSVNYLTVISEGITAHDGDAGHSTVGMSSIKPRGGSVTTVVPPELAAWQPTSYLQGPIKLPKPPIVPRKNSLATLEPFQEAVDQMYQQVLIVPRRESDDAVEHDICEFFLSFGLGVASFENGLLKDKLRKGDEKSNPDTSHIRTPPVASPVEKQIARESIACMLRPRSSSAMPPEPARSNNKQGTAIRTWQDTDVSSTSTGYARKESLTLGGQKRPTAAGVLLPLPEMSVLRSVSELDLSGDSQSMNGSMGSSGFDWDDGVSEIEAASTWVAPMAAMPKRHPLRRDQSTKRLRNPVAKIRRLVATASAIL